MIYVKFWLFEHEGLLLAFAGLFFWTFANYWYLRGDIRRIRRENSGHTWSVDMATKTGKCGRKRIILYRGRPGALPLDPANDSRP